MGHGYLATLLIDFAQKNPDLKLAGVIPIQPVL